MIDENYVYTPEHEPQAAAPNGYRHNGPRIPRKTEWFVLPDEFGQTDPPMRVKVWVTYPRRLIDDIRSGELDRQKPALQQIVLEHNGWIDEDGEPLPPANTDEFWDQVPDIIAGAVIAIVTVEVGKAAASVMRKQRR